MNNLDHDIRRSLLVLEESVADPSYVGSAPSEEAYRIAHEWLNAHKPSSADLFYQQVQTAAVEYVRLRKG